MEKSNLSRAAQHHLIMAIIESEKDGKTEADKASENQEAETENQSAEIDFRTHKTLPTDHKMA